MTKRALITGGNKGIGLETSRKFLASGYEVIVVARDLTAFSLQGHKGVDTKPFDLTKIELISELVHEVGQIDVLVNNAGVMWSLPFNSYSDEKKKSLMALNLEAPVALMTGFGSMMRDQGAGRIVNVASIAGEIGHPDIWYGVSKAGLLNATKSFAKILGPSGIQINAVASGPVDTAMLSVIPKDRVEAIVGSSFARRPARPDEIAEAVFWLGSSAPEYINGTCIDINSGALMR